MHPADAGAGGPVQTGRAASRSPPRSASSISSGSLCPPAAKSLMPLSGIGLCEAESITPRSALVSPTRYATAGRGQHADPHHVGAGAGQPGDHGRLEHLAAGPGVAADDGERRVAAVALGEDVRGRDRDRQRQLRGEIGVGQAAYAVGAEETTHARHLRGRQASAIESTRKRERPGTPPRAGAHPAVVRRQVQDQRFEYCGALRAFLRPYFLLSLTRASRVRKPAFFRAGRSSGSLVDQRAGDARRSAPAWPVMPPPRRLAMTSNCLGLLGGHQRLADELLVHLAREVRLELAAVAGDLAGAGHEAHPDDGLLAAADGLDRAVTGTRGADRRRRGRLGARRRSRRRVVDGLGRPRAR